MIAKLPITTKISAETLAQLEAQATAQGLTRSGAITLAIEAWLGIEPASPTGTLARLDSLSGQLEALSGRVSAIEARLAPTAPVAAPAPTAPTPAPAPAPTAPTPAPAPAPTEGQGQGLDINSACQLAGLTDRDWKRNLGTVIKRRYQTSPDRALTARGWRKVKRLWYPPA